MLKKLIEEKERIKSAIEAEIKKIADKKFKNSGYEIGMKIKDCNGDFGFIAGYDTRLSYVDYDVKIKIKTNGIKKDGTESKREVYLGEPFKIIS